MPRQPDALLPDAPKCPQCQHPVILNRASCGGCGRAYHELCLKRGCVNGADCGAAAGGGGGSAKWLALPFLAATLGLGAACVQFKGRITGNALFAPALATGLIGMVSGLKLGEGADRARSRLGRFAMLPLTAAAFAAAAVAGAGREIPYTAHLTAIGAAGALVALLALAADKDRRPALLGLLCAAHLFLVAALVLTPAFPRVMAARLKGGGPAAPPGTGPAIAGSPAPGAGLGSLLGISSGAPAFAVKGVMSVGGRRQAMTDTGSFAVGDSVPGVGTIQSITDDEVGVRFANGQTMKYAVPH